MIKSLFSYVSLIIAIILFYFGNSGGFSRKIVDKIFPCIQEPMNSFPCNGVYDIWLMVFAGVLGIVAALFIVKGFIK